MVCWHEVVTAAGNKKPNGHAPCGEWPLRWSVIRLLIYLGGSGGRTPGPGVDLPGFQAAPADWPALQRWLPATMVGEWRIGRLEKPLVVIAPGLSEPPNAHAMKVTVQPGASWIAPAQS